jgi:hypothetical protein
MNTDPKLHEEGVWANLLGGMARSAPSRGVKSLFGE